MTKTRQFIDSRPVAPPAELTAQAELVLELLAEPTVRFRDAKAQLAVMETVARLARFVSMFESDTAVTNGQPYGEC